ncbi:NAD-dependent epimerase/dehydratase family protein [Winogradskyella schleiferi]|uniref:NAD-dependent epimerase/dehydratase family protein n=1 Tax=Winogradskyella schleiferi TaxID=2686078 RepID=UPI0015BD57D4|nr:NAD-dependent epimerase/dehydratase family protein [Winogradskyella schleiferi]
MKKAGIIGGSGFIGSHITKLFLENNFEVKSSTTDITNEKKYQHLMALDKSENLHICELDVLDKEQIKQFVSDCDIVVHSGTPFQLDFEDAKTELFDPTIKGTENFLDVINNTISVKKVVILASVAAFNTNFPLPADGKSASDRFNEDDTPFISEESHPYAQAKFMANQTVNAFIENHQDLDLEIVSVSPVMVMGKSLSNREDSTSTGIQFLFKHKIAPNPFIQMFYDEDIDMAIVNVKDVAIAVYKTAIITGIHGKNYLLSSETYPVSDVSLMLNKKPPNHAPKVIYQNQLAKQQLGISFQSVENTLQQYNA